jgi:hypothetical protein
MIPCCLNIGGGLRPFPLPHPLQMTLWVLWAFRQPPFSEPPFQVLSLTHVHGLCQVGWADPVVQSQEVLVRLRSAVRSV